MSLERAYRMKVNHAEAEKRESTVDPITGEEMSLGKYDRTLAEIFADRDEQNQFINNYLYSAQPDQAKNIAESLAADVPLTADQLRVLESARGIYNVRCAEIEKARTVLNADEMNRIAAVDSRIRDVIGIVGAEKAASLIGDQLKDVAFTDSKSFNRMLGSFRRVNKVETGKRAKSLDAEVTAALNGLGVSEEKYFEVTRDGLTPDTKKNLQEMAANNFGFFRKAVDFATSGSLSRRTGDEMYRQLEDQAKLLQECDTQRLEIGKVLRGTLTPEVRLAMQKSILSGEEPMVEKPEETIKTVDEYKRLKEEVENPQPRFEEYLKGAASQRGIDLADDSDHAEFLDEMKDHFAEQEIQKQKSHHFRGAFAALIAFLFRSRTKESIKSQLK